MQKHVVPDHQQQSALRALWAITWRSTVFIPVILVFGTFLLAVALSVVVLPFFVAVYAYWHLWQRALAYFAAWIVIYCVWRGFRLRRFFEWPPSFL